MPKGKSPWAIMTDPPPAICLPDLSAASFIGPTRDAPVATCCPNCGRLNDAVTGVSTHGRPSPGDAAICFGCHTVLIYTDDLTQRLATEDEARRVLARLRGP